MSGTCGSAVNGSGGGGEIMLFGVRVTVDSMRKSVSLNNLSQYEQPQDNNNRSSNHKDDVAAADAAAAAAYASADDAVQNSSRASRERKRGVAWTEEEHKLFLLGLKKVGKGDWKGISRNFVRTRTPTQVASHAQKYFLRRSNLNRRRRRRSSLFDITTDSVMAIPMEEEQVNQQDNNPSQSYPLLPPLPTETSNKASGFSMMPALPVVLRVPNENPMENLSMGQITRANAKATKLIHSVPVPVPVLPAAQASTVSDLNLNLNLAVDPSPLSVKLSLPSDQRESSSRRSAFQVMQTFNNNGDRVRDSIISVA